MPVNNTPHPTRRRALAAIATMAGFPLAAFAGLADPGRGAPPVVRWRGIAMGARAGITLCHPDEVRARRVLAACLDEIARLERVYSLYRADSELAALNRDGRLGAPSHDLVALMGKAARYGALSGGAFDITVQPLW
ncbi:MAG: FAD:protein FMN transferase, partial [Alphaproteobacteria bacterium]